MYNKRYNFFLSLSNYKCHANVVALCNSVIISKNIFGSTFFWTNWFYKGIKDIRMMFQTICIPIPIIY